jgi:hypothetical protein
MVPAQLLGHLFPLMPLARAMAEAGHEVRVATAGTAGTRGASLLFGGINDRLTEVRAEIVAMPPPEQIAERLAGLR